MHDWCIGCEVQPAGPGGLLCSPCLSASPHEFPRELVELSDRQAHEHAARCGVQLAMELARA